MISTAHLHDNAIHLRETVHIAAERANRDPGEITIVAVSKTFERALIDEAYELGFRVFGESRVQEIREKFAEPLPVDASLHMIGQMQTNKLRQVLPLIQALETLDRASLVAALEKELARPETTLDVMLQVNVSGEAQKSGISPIELPELLEPTLKIPAIRPVGLMTMAPLGADEPMLRSVFGGLRILRDEMQQRFGIALPALSMGMSSDYEIAIAEGATHVRIGRSLFGER